MIGFTRVGKEYFFLTLFHIIAACGILLLSLYSIVGQKRHFSTSVGIF